MGVNMFELYTVGFWQLLCSRQTGQVKQEGLGLNTSKGFVHPSFLHSCLLEILR